MAGHGHVVPNEDGTRARCGGPGICGDCSRELVQQQRQQVLPIQSFQQARQTMSQAFRDDKGTLRAYHANIAWLLQHPEHGVSHEKAQILARDVMALVFGLTEQEATPS